ncbi:MAG: carbohydrate kinase [Desulfobacteraceae bacterium]|nr:carbohydrate kinase [Desulfobacteraceae bacterium]
MILAIGEILYDIFPEYKRLGGAPFNFAFHVKNFGMPICLISKVGNDLEGREIISFLQQHDFPIENIQTDNRHSTGKVLIKLNGKGVPVFNIMPNVAYNYIEFNTSIASLLNADTELIYFGTLAQRSEYGFKTIQRILSQRPTVTKCLYDINLRPHCFTEQVIVESLRQCDLLKLNDEELEILKQIFAFKKSSRSFIEHLMIKYRLEMLFLTKGKNGSELFTLDKHFQKKPRKLNDAADTVGAGDAYTAMLSIGYINKWPLEQILEKASEFAARICEIEGAVPTDPNFYKKIIAGIKGKQNEKE